MNGHVVYGQALFDSGRYEEAQVTFVAALGLDPENLIALRHLGDIARIGNDAPVAIDWYNRVLDADPRNQEILAFIEELKLAPAAPAAPADVVETVAEGRGNTLEVEPPKRPSLGATPTMPIPQVSGPQKRPSLMDMSIDLSMPAGADPSTTPVTGTIPTVPTPRTSGAMRGTSTPGAPAPVGDLDFGDVDFGEPAQSAQMRESMAAASAADEPLEMNIDGPMGLETTDPLPAAEATQMDSSLGWEMPGDVDLDAPQAEAASTDDDSVPVGDTPQVFVTETMAELYLQQGFRDEALQVYRQLAEQNPDDKSLQDRIENLERGDRGSMSLGVVSDDAPEAADISIDELAPTPAARAPSPTPAGMVSARAFFAALATRRALRGDGSAPTNGISAPTPIATRAVTPISGTIDGLFGGGGAGATDDAIGLALATAVGQGEAGAAIRGRPTTQAASELSLDSVFRSDSAMRSSGPVARQSSVLKFDQFFASDGAATDGAAPQAAPAPAPPAASGDTAAPADDAQFQSWLKGLKGK